MLFGLSLALLKHVTANLNYLRVGLLRSQLAVCSLWEKAVHVLLLVGLFSAV